MSTDQAKAIADEAYAVAKALHQLAARSPHFAERLTRQAQEWQAEGTPYWMQAMPIRRQVSA